ncbi:YdcF family protein [Lichenicoccus roseus]|uniref:YdcF family protein n=1 Tax=Lichenicoccus roseus TaxID=2683649 RepID=A0A5R9J8Z6_9PROT|nr:YdcF family protein [Lichenicoccus roseus]TLU73459.1 YdcF family protein [Lichenicoccus roseus]
MSRPLRLAAGLVLLTGLALGAGFAWFAHDALQPSGLPGQADGIVALTGGSGRIELALSLLEGGHAHRLLISGVRPSLDLNRLARASRLHIPEGTAPAAIAIGHDATTTSGNAAETASWARANDLHSLIVVTAGYHMRRALAEIGAALPGVRLMPCSVQPPALLRPFSPGTLRLLLVEYLKWLAVEIGQAVGALRTLA